MRLTTLEDRLARRLATIPLEAQRLCRLRSSFVARYSRSQPGELGAAAARFGGLGSTDGGTAAAVVDLCAVASDVKRQCAREVVLCVKFCKGGHGLSDVMRLGGGGSS